MKSWTEWLIGIIAIVGAVGLLIALMLYNPADSPTQQEHVIVTPAVTAPPQVKASVVTPEAKPVEMPPEPQTATENDLTVEEEEIYAYEETGAEESYQKISENGQAYEEDDFEDRSDTAEVDSEQTSQEGVVQEGTVYLGTWTVTFYCDCTICTGQWSGSPTASGAWPTAWHTVACGSLPFGTEIYIDGLGYFVVEDRGVEGDWVDIYLDNHDLCNEYGLQYREVYLVG